jgi:SPP1 family predicted phage head-tail adaptor
MLEPGRLRHRITLEQLATSLDAEGGMVESWTPIAEVWGEVAPVSGREYIAAQAVQAGIVARITIRHRTGVEPTMRVIHQGATYNIRAVLPDPHSGREWLTLMCEAGVNHG